MRGHETRFHIYSRRYLSTIEDAGQPVRPTLPIMSDCEADQVTALDQGRGIRHPFRIAAVPLFYIRPFASPQT